MPWLMRFLKFVGFLAVSSVFVYSLLGVYYLIPPNVLVTPSPFEPPAMEIGGNAVNMSFPLLVINSGFSPIDNIMIFFRMVNDAGEPIAEVPTISTVIPAKSIVPLHFTFYLNFSRILNNETIIKFINSSISFKYHAYVAFRYLHSRVGFAASLMIPLEVGSPMQNFNVTNVTVTASTINVTFSFTNRFKEYRLNFSSYILNPDGDPVTDIVSYSSTVPVGNFTDTITYTVTAPSLPLTGDYTVIFNFTEPFVFVIPFTYTIS
ncbi:MAG: hypothetical protein ACTSWP_05985 [Candidatus Freyarchaeota archaeon]